VCTDRLAAHISSGKPTIFALWHEALGTTLYTQRNTGFVAMVSQHQDGEILATIMRSYGMGTVRGSTTRGGTSALREMVRLAQSGVPLAITPDGPKGPRRVAQPGTVEIARRSGAVIVPMAPTYRPVYRFRSWDRLAFPWLCARGLILYGEPIEISKESEPRLATAKLQDGLDRVMERANIDFDQLWASGARRGPHPRRAVEIA